MPDTVQAYIEASDNALDYSDHQIALLEQRALEDIDDLYRSPNNRDDELWALFGVDSELTIGDYDEVQERDIDWTLGMSGIAAASQSQFFLDERESTVIRPAAYRKQVLAGFALSRSELVLAGKRGFEVAGVAEFETIQASVLSELSFLKEMNNVELYTRLHDIGALRTPDQMISSASGYVSRMTNYRPGSPQFKEEVSKLIDVNSKRGLNSMNRRAVAQIHTIQQLGGDVAKEMVWIVEGGKNTCSYCSSRAGQVRTYDEWLEFGLPGADVCLGGDLCRCQLASTDA